MKHVDPLKGFGTKMWSENFYNAKKFFESKGNMKTRSKLKDKWFKDFKNGLIFIDVNSREQHKDKISKNEFYPLG